MSTNRETWAVAVLLVVVTTVLAAIWIGRGGLSRQPQTEPPAKELTDSVSPAPKAEVDTAKHAKPDRRVSKKHKPATPAPDLPSPLNKKIERYEATE